MTMAFMPGTSCGRRQQCREVEGDVGKMRQDEVIARFNAPIYGARAPGSSAQSSAPKIQRQGSASMEYADKFAIAELINAWGLYRDQGKWKELRGTFTADGHISVSWFRGSFEQFVERCRASHGTGHTWSRHHLSAPVIKVDKDRAVAETSVVIRVRQKFG